jgi:hypothetical protein
MQTSGNIWIIFYDFFYTTPFISNFTWAWNRLCVIYLIGNELSEHCPWTLNGAIEYKCTLPTKKLNTKDRELRKSDGILYNVPSFSVLHLSLTSLFTNFIHPTSPHLYRESYPLHCHFAVCFFSPQSLKLLCVVVKNSHVSDSNFATHRVMELFVHVTH